MTADIEAGFVALATADAATAAIAADRFSPLQLPDDPDFPAVTYRLVSTVDTYTLDGHLSLVQIRLQVDSWDVTYGGAKALAKAIYNLLNAYEGTLPNGIVVVNVQRDGQQSGFDQDDRAYYVQTDWMIQFVEQ